MNLHTQDEIIALIQQLVAEETNLSVDQLDIHKSMGSLGLNSINSIYLLEKLENELDLSLNPLMFYDYPTIHSFGRYLYDLKKVHE